MKRIPRILKIVGIRYPNITCAFNTSEYRRINVTVLFRELGIQEGDFGYQIIRDRQLFSAVSLENNTLAWLGLRDVIKLSEKEQIESFFHLDPVLIYKHSIVDQRYTSRFNLGKKIKSVRKRSRLTQEALAASIGSNKQYISKIENNKADLEFKTLRKIFELGLNRNVFISHFEKGNILKGHSNSILSFEFIDWAMEKKNELTLIEGIDDKIRELLEEANIKTTRELSKLEFPELFGILDSKQSVDFFHQPELWPIQAKYIIAGDWFNLIHLQRTINSGNGGGNTHSKIEEAAKKEINESIFEVG